MYGKRGDTFCCKRNQTKGILALLAGLSVVLYFFVDFNVKQTFFDIKENFDLNEKTKEQNENKAFFVDTPGCKMPSFNVIDTAIAQYMYKVPKFSCNKALTTTTYSKIILNIDKSELRDFLNVTDIEQIICYYQQFKRNSDNTNYYIKKKHFFQLLEGTKVFYEFVKIACYSEQQSLLYKDYHFFTPPKNGGSSQTHTETEENKLNVMIIGIDSVSRLNFLRQMNETSHILRNKFNAVEMLGFNKVGDNTYPNLVPVLTGLDENELSMACLTQKHNTSYDNCPFIWKRYKDAKFRTVYAEDVAQLGLFNYFKKGFKEQPADYYLRPVLIEMEKNIAYFRKANINLCLGGRRPVDVVLQYINKLVPRFKEDKFFSFFWMASLTHDFFNMPMQIDEDISKLLLDLNSKNVLNSTILFLMSDHGMRWGSFRKTYQGMMEERQPFLFIVAPPWFPSTYPSAYSNLRQNSYRLTTHFDLYATLADLIDPHSSITTAKIRSRSIELLEMDQMPRSLSLFLPIPTTRTCDNAGIAAHWCTCHEKQFIPTNDVRVQRAARFVVKQINQKLHPYPQCRVLFLNSILEANVFSSNKNILEGTQDHVLSDITVRLQTKPGLAEFEATIRFSDISTTLTGTISRTNLYGRQSYCIDDYALKMFCFCNR